MIQKDGSKSITRENPEKYAAKFGMRHHGSEHGSVDAFHGTINLTNQAMLINGDGKSRASSLDPYSNLD